jgi:adenylate kinase family enzyme
MIATSPDEPRTTRILIRGTDGVGKSTFAASIQALPLPASTGRKIRGGASSPDTEEPR